MNAASIRKVLGWTMALAALAGTTHLGATTFYWDADGDGSTALGGSGTWDASTALWRSGSTTGTLTAWPNTSPNADQAQFHGPAGTVMIAAGWTAHVNLINFQDNSGYVVAPGNESSVLAFSGSDPRVQANAKNATINSTINVGAGFTVAMNGATLTLNNAAGNQLTGLGQVSVVNDVGSRWGSALTINYSQSGFPGGFRVHNDHGSQRQATLTPAVAGAMGTGESQVSGWGRVAYLWGAQSAGGATDGGMSGVAASLGGTIDIVGTWADTKERFVVEDGGVLRGSSSQLGAVRRVASFSNPIDATGPEAVLLPLSVISHSTVGTSSVADLGQTADVLFGLGANFNDAAFALTIGAGTPWIGLAKDSSAMGDSAHRRLQQGTITIDDGEGTVQEIVLRSAGIQYGGADQHLYIGSAADCPTFQTVPGGGKVAARIMSTGGKGSVTLDTTNPLYADAIQQFVVSRHARLVSGRSGALAELPVVLEGAALLFVPATAGSADSAGALTLDGYSNIHVARKTAGTPDTLALASLTRTGRAVLRLSSSQAAGLGGDERITLAGTAGLVRGNLVDPWIHRGTDYLQYGGTGFAIYGSYVTSLASLGNGVVFKGSGTLAGDANLDSMLMTGSVSGNFTLTAGVLPDASRADRVGLMCISDNQSLAPAFDAGTAELLVHYPQGPTRYLNLNGAVTAGGLTKTGTGIVSLRNAGNSIGGEITVWEGILRVDNNGNGLADAAAVQVASGATYQILSPSANVETNAKVGGAGTVDIASGKTLTVTDELVAGDAESSLNVTSAGTLQPGAFAEAVFELDFDSQEADVARLSVAGVLDLVEGAAVRIASVANLPAGEFEKTFTLVAYGTRSGAFATTVSCPEGVTGTLAYDDTAKTVSVTLTKAAGGGTVLIVR